MHEQLEDWLRRTGISPHEGARLLRERDVSWFDIYGDTPTDDFARGAREVENALAANPEVVLWWSKRKVWEPYNAPSVHTDKAVTEKRFDDVHAALSYVDSLSRQADFHCPLIFSSTGVLWDWSSLEQRQAFLVPIR